MNSVDYNSKYSRVVDLQNRDSKEQTRNHEEQIDNLTKAHAHTIKKQSKTHMKQKDETEAVFNDRYAKMNTSQKEVLKNKNEAYEKSILKNKEDFHKERRDNIKEFDTSFADLKDKFSSNTEEIKLTNESMREQQLAQYKSRVQNIRKDADQNLKDYQDHSLGDNQNIQEKIQVEKKQLIRQQEKDLNTVMKQDIVKRNDLKNRVVKDVDRIRETQKIEIAGARERAKGNFGKIVKATDKKVADMQVRLDSESSRQRKILQQENKKLNNAFSERFTEQDKLYNRRSREQEVRAKIQGIGAGSINAEIQKKQNDNLDYQRDNRVKTVVDQKDRLAKEFAMNRTEASERFQNDFKELKLKNAEHVEMERRQHTDFSANQHLDNKIALERSENTHQIGSNLSRQIADEKLNGERKIASRTISKLKKTFGKSMDDAVMKSQDQFSTARKEMDSEKKVLEKRLHEQNSHANSFIKQEYITKLSKVKQGLQKQVNDLENKNKEMRQVMNDSIADITIKTENEITRQRDLAKADTKYQIDNQKEMATQRIDALKGDIGDIHKSYSGKMNKQRLDNQNKLKVQNRTHEVAMQSDRKRYQGMIDQNKKFSDREMARIQMSNKAEKERLVTQYENRISKLEQISRNKVKEIENFNTMQRA